ncbi:hypothetical protein AABB24_005776 [Solanum stoloniferum]|uniref:Integrase catalytic domain-containing protein n=1 Tax=Solanum stoloniferum TaxID=62892 RepID=A0ABD2UYM2_9SOLN
MFYLIHVDLWGPYSTTNFDGNKYFLTIVDDFSRMSWIFLLKHKYDVSMSIQPFLKFFKNQFAKTIKVIQTDNGTEFVNSVCETMFKEMRVIHQRSCPYTPQQNGVVERKHRHLLEVTRALRFQAKIPLQFWGHCMLAASHIINRLPSSVLNFQTPYEKLYGRKPDLSHFRTIGCLCFAKVLPANDKMMARSRTVDHMGYSEIQKGYILFDIATRSFFVRRDDIFREEVFLFSHTDITDSQPVFVDNLQASDFILQNPSH